jgi:hypothetical protein
MNEEVLRQMVKEAVARRMGRSDETVEVPALLLQHASHYRYALTPSGAASLIEPNEQCKHSG